MIDTKNRTGRLSNRKFFQIKYNYVCCPYYKVVAFSLVRDHIKAKETYIYIYILTKLESQKTNNECNSIKAVYRFLVLLESKYSLVIFSSRLSICQSLDTPMIQCSRLHSDWLICSALLLCSYHTLPEIWGRSPSTLILVNFHALD